MSEKNSQPSIEVLSMALAEKQYAYSLVVDATKHLDGKLNSLLQAGVALPLLSGLVGAASLGEIGLMVTTFVSLLMYGAMIIVVLRARLPVGIVAPGPTEVEIIREKYLRVPTARAYGFAIGNMAGLIEDLAKINEAKTDQILLVTNILLAQVSWLIVSWLGAQLLTLA